MNQEDMTDYFPIPDAATMDKFLKNDEGLTQRKKDFQSLIYAAVGNHQGEMIQKQFMNILSTTCFKREYLASFRWPNIW